MAYPHHNPQQNPYGQPPQQQMYSPNPYAHAQPMILVQPGMMVVGPAPGGTPTMKRLAIGISLFFIGLVVYFAGIGIELLLLLPFAGILSLIGLMITLWAIVTHKSFVTLQNGQVVPAQEDTALMIVRIVCGIIVLVISLYCCMGTLVGTLLSLYFY